MFWLMEKNCFDQPVKYDLRTYENIQKIETGQRDDYTTGCLLDNNYFKNYHKMTSIGLSKQALNVDTKALQQINFTQSLDWAEGATTSFIEEAKEAKLEFSGGTVKLLRIYFTFFLKGSIWPISISRRTNLILI